MSAEPSNEPKRSLYRGRIVVQAVGVVLLGACTVLLLLGLTLWYDKLYGPQFVLFWSWCLLLAVAAIGVALLDMAMVNRASKRSQRELFRREFMSREFVEKVREQTTEQDEKK